MLVDVGSMIEPSGPMATSSHGRAGPFVLIRTGRVVQLRVERLMDVADVEQLDAAVTSAIREAGPGASICADYRAASPLPPDVARAWSKAMRNTNGALARSALLVDPRNALFNLQLERVVKCAGNPARRLFSDLAELRDWIAGVLGDRERDSIGAFLLEQ